MMKRPGPAGGGGKRLERFTTLHRSQQCLYNWEFCRCVRASITNSDSRSKAIEELIWNSFSPPSTLCLSLMNSLTLNWTQIE